MQNLKAYVESMNSWNKLFGNYRPLDLKNAADRQAIATDIDCKLSPENLTCDGELPRAEVNRRYRELMSAARALYKLDPKVKFYEWSSEIEA